MDLYCAKLCSITADCQSIGLFGIVALEKQWSLLVSLFENEYRLSKTFIFVESSYQILTKGRSIFYEKGRHREDCRFEIVDCRLRILDLFKER